LRNAALEAELAGSTFIAVPSPAGPLSELCAVLEAWRDGRPFEHLPLGHPPGAALMRQLEDLRKKMAADPEPIDFDAIRRDTIREIEAEHRDRDRRARQKAKRARRAERRAQEREQALSG
jgi:hypothetical protein